MTPVPVIEIHTKASSTRRRVLTPMGTRVVLLVVLTILLAVIRLS